MIASCWLQVLRCFSHGSLWRLLKTISDFYFYLPDFYLSALSFGFLTSMPSVFSHLTTVLPWSILLLGRAGLYLVVLDFTWLWWALLGYNKFCRTFQGVSIQNPMAGVQTPAGVHRSFPVFPIACVRLTHHKARSHVVESGAFLCTLVWPIQPSNNPPSLFYTLTWQGWTVLGSGGLY